MAKKQPVKRIKLETKTAKSKKATISPVKNKEAKTVRRSPGFLGSFLGYFRGSWEELRQVRWPNRSATWGLTLAVIGFTIFFAVLILALDAGFQYFFKEVLLK